MSPALSYDGQNQNTRQPPGTTQPLNQPLLRCTIVGMAAPLLVFDVNETLSDMAPLGERFSAAELGLADPPVSGR
jgi:hypothetical protein